MKKYRIITNGTVYRIQYRWCLLFWRIETETNFDRDGEHRHIVEHRTLEGAKKWIETRLSPGWRIVS